jgi:hypothetical protein
MVESPVRTLEPAKSLTAAEGARPASGAGPPDAVNRTGTLGLQQRCPHPSTRWARGRELDYRVCECCLAVLEKGWPDHHPEISRWMNEGGAVGREALLT